MLPGFDRVLGQPPADRRGRRVADAALDDEPMQLRTTEARERNAAALGQLARDRLDLGDLLRGGSGAGVPRVFCRSIPRSAPHRTVFATARRVRAASAAAYRSQRCSNRPRRTAQAWLATPHGADGNNTRHGAQARGAPHRSTRSDIGCGPPSPPEFAPLSITPSNRTEITAGTT